MIVFVSLQSQEGSISLQTVVCLCEFMHVSDLPINTCSACRTHRLVPPFFPSFFPSACCSISAVLLRVTAAMAGAVCGQTLPVVVKAHTISRSDGPPSFYLSPFFCLPFIVLHGGRE